MEAKGIFSKLNTQILLAIVAIIISACSPAQKATIKVQGTITKDTTWKSEFTYILDGQVQVVNGATLTIEPGTLIKANPGEYPNASMLIISRGSKINAVGTYQNPIVFTSLDDNINTVQESSQTMLSENNKGLWGGIIILGAAPISIEDGENETFYVGLNPSDPSSYYGGDQADDNSGSLKYVSIRFGGSYMGTGSESNGLTLSGVGNKTQIDHIEIYANQDDGIEFFGGNVNASNLIIYSSGDDGIDLDEGFTGNLKNIFVILGQESDSGIEISGGPGSFEGNFSISDVKLTVHSATEDQRILNIDEKAKGSIKNILAANFMDVSKIILSSNDVTLDQLQITKDGKISNSMDEISSNKLAKGQINFSENIEINNQQAFDWTLTQQKISN